MLFTVYLPWNRGKSETRVASEYTRGLYHVIFKSTCDCICVDNKCNPSSMTSISSYHVIIWLKYDFMEYFSQEKNCSYLKLEGYCRYTKKVAVSTALGSIIDGKSFVNRCKLKEKLRTPSNMTTRCLFVMRRGVHFAYTLAASKAMTCRMKLRNICIWWNGPLWTVFFQRYEKRLEIFRCNTFFCSYVSYVLLCPAMGVHFHQRKTKSHRTMSLASLVFHSVKWNLYYLSNIVVMCTFSPPATHYLLEINYSA